MRHAALIVAVLCALALAAGAHGIEVEGGTIAALNSECDIGLSVSVGTELPEWVPVLGEHIGFVDLLTVNTEQAIGLSLSIRKAEADDGWRIGATITTPNEGPREVLGYLRYGVAIKF